MLGRIIARSLHCSTSRALPVRQTYRTADFLKSRPHSLTVNLVPLWRGQRKQGVRYGPGILLSRLNELCPDVTPTTNYVTDTALNLPPLNSTRSPEDLVETLKALSDQVSASSEGGLVVNLGGDHAIPLLTIPAMLRRHPDLRVIWIDAHADINSPASSPSGNVHGMPVWFLSEASTEGRLPLDRLVYVGVREMDPAEEALITDHGIRNYTKAELEERGVGTVAMEIIERLGLEDHPVHISFDVDALDPSLAPSTGTAVPEGLSSEDVAGIFRAVKRTGSLVSCDIVEFNPLIGSEADVETTLQSISPVLQELVETGHGVSESTPPRQESAA